MDATIIAASLNDKELKSSIDTLVSYVDNKIKGMATNFDNEIKRMKTSLQNLGDIKIDSSGASDAGSSRRTKRNSEEAKSVRETTVAYDQLALATQKAMQPKSAEQSFYAFIQNYREQAARLASELKSMPSASLDRQIAEYNRFEKEISNVQRRIQELRQQLNEVGKNPNASRFEVKAITDEISRLENNVKRLTSEQIASTRRIANEDSAAMAQKQALYNKTVQLIRELTNEQQRSNSVLKEQVSTQDQLTRKIERQAEIIRQRLKEDSSSFAFWGTRVIYDPNDARNAKNKQAQLSIEQQLLKAHQEQVKITQERIASEQRANQAKKETVSTTQAQAQAEQQVTQAQRQRNVGQSAKQTFQTYESFTQALAHVLGLQQQEIKLANSETASYNRLQQTLKTLQAAYNQLSNSERNSENGRALVASMHEVQRAIQKIQQQAARPVNLMATMGLSEKTLDDIAYKMQMLSRYRNGINLANPNSKNEIQRVNSELERLKSTQDKLIGQNARYAHSNELLGRSFDYIKNRIAFVLTVGTMTQFTKSIYEIRGQYELLERSIGILFDSMQQGSRIFAELNAMAIKSPFTTMELGAAAKQLSAYDIAAKDVVDTTKRLADMAAAVGVPIERLTYALGQIKAYGYLNARDARMFANAGIPLVQNLADMYTKLEGRLVSVGDIYDRIKKKAISFEDVLKVVNEMTDEGGRFFNFQEKAADTLKVKLANLTLAYNNMLNEIGKSNQTLITAPLIGLKKLYENWRSISNAIQSLIISYGLLKGAQILYIAYTSKVSLATAAADVASKRLVGTCYAMKRAFMSLAANPFTWITVALTSLVYLYLQMRDLQEQTERFNKALSDNAKENIDSINKFFNEYKKEIDTINALSTTDQQKMWEKISEEIEKTSKNAKQYIDILEKIPDISKRVSTASNYLSQIQQIQQEVQRLADHGAFSVGGGFADDGLAEDLAEYEEAMNTLIQKYGSLEKADEHFRGRTKSGGDIKFTNSWGNYINAINEALAELNKFSDALDKANIGKILGDGTNEEQLANLREFTSIIRDNFLATESGQKISSEGRALLNKQLDEWVAKQGVANGLLETEYAQIEANRTAWEIFFSQLNKKDKETIDYLVSTNQTGSEEFKEIWDKAANSMKESAITSYNAIQDQIASLRNTPDIVINVVYRVTKEQLDDQQQQFKEDFLTPKGVGVLSAEAYLKQVKELTTKYGRFQKKEGEDNVEWEKRLGETYRENESKLKSLNAQLKNSANLSDVDRVAKEKERDAIIDENKVLDEVKAKQNFNYEKDKKNGRRKRGGNKKDVIAEALQKEIQLVKELQSSYDKLTKAGLRDMQALTTVRENYGATIAMLNATLKKSGLSSFDVELIKGKNPRAVLEYFERVKKELTDKNLSNLKRMELVEGVIKTMRIDVQTYDMKKVTDGLNSELGKIKDEYELAVELDANPELGGIFADMMGIKKDELAELPRTYDQMINKLQGRIDKLFSDNNMSGVRFDLVEMLNQSKFEDWVKEQGNTLDDDFVKALNKIREYANKVRHDETDETKKSWSQLIDKYGQLQYKLVKIAKDATVEMKTIVNKFGNKAQKQLALDLADKISISEDPSEIARLQEQLRQLLNQVTQGNEQAVNINAAVQNQQNQLTSKAYWDDFKDSDYYTMMFEDMARNSTRAIQLIIDKMKTLKDKVKEDPASMKALSKSLQDAQKELESRSSTVTILDALKEMRTAYNEVATARKNLADADKEVGDAEKALESSKDDADKTAAAVERLRIAREHQKQATLDAANAETKYRTASKKLQGGMETLSNELQNVQSIFGAVAKLFAAAGDDDTADAINAISEGFSIMTTVIMGVVAAMVLLESTVPWLLAIAAALSVIVGLVSWLSGNNDKQIEKDIKKSEIAVKQLENSYKNLQRAVNEAYGASQIAARKAAVANKELQLVELQRQLQLEKSKSSKKRDAGRIADLEGQIIDLKNELKDLRNDITNSFLGISSVSDAVGSMMDDIVDALRNGEDAMQGFNDSIDDMIANMIKQVFSARILGPMIEKIWQDIDDEIQQRGKGWDDWLAESQKALTHIETNTNNTGNGYRFFKDEYGAWRYTNSNNAQKLAYILAQGYEEITYEEWKAMMESYIAQAKAALKSATTPTMNDIRRYAGDLREVSPELEAYMDDLEAILREMGLIKDATSEEALSKLQQGIQGVTEDTAGAIEAYMNIVAQRVFEQNVYLQEIRDHLNNFDLDVQLGTLSQMLLQLQQSYQVQQNIESILTGVLNPSGRAIVVELNS